MWLAGIQVPDELWDAQELGTLVVFAGAGVSRDAPSNLLGFEDLVWALAEDSHVQWDGPSEESPDRFLGRLVDEYDYDVHGHASRLLSDPTSQPNSTHRALASLFREETLRIVTTNFDKHLTTAARERFSTVDEYSSPVLPPADDFRGVVYLHGSLDDAARIVLTDKDFGRAYVTRGWTRRFLLELFRSGWESARLVVLFVGYRHEDPILDYLARGLPNDTRRYALTADREDELARWRRRGILPVPYPDEDGAHTALVAFLERWASLASLDMAGAIGMLTPVLGQGPPLDVDNEGLLLRHLSHAERARMLLNQMTSLEWLEWVADTDLFKGALSDFSQTGAQLAWEFGWWLSTHFIESNPQEGLAAAVGVGAPIAPSFWNAVAHRFHAERPSSHVLGLWLPLLVEEGDSTRDFLSYLLAGGAADPDLGNCLFLLRSLTTPTLEYRVVPTVFAASGETRVSAELEVKGDDYWLLDAWEKVFKPRTSEVAPELLDIATSNLSRAAELSAVTSEGGRAWDPLSFRRPAIRDLSSIPNSVSQTTWADVLVDIARDTLQHVTATDPELAKGFARTWLDSGSLLLVRLGVHSLEHEPGLDADGRIRSVIEKGLLFRHGLKHEVYELLALQLPSISDACIDELLTAAQRGPIDEPWADNPDLFDRSVVDLLTWLSRKAPANESISAALSSAGGGPSIDDVPDEDLGGSSGLQFRELVPPVLPVQDLATVNPRHSRERLDWLLTYEEGSWVDPRGLVLDNVQAAALRSTAFSMRLANGLALDGLWESDLWQPLLEAWADKPLSDSAWRCLHALLMQHAALGSYGLRVARVIEKGGKDFGPNPTWRAGLLLELSDKLWAELATVAPSEELQAGDWLTTAINDAGGALALFLVGTLSWEVNSREVEGIPEAYRPRLEAIVAAESQAARLGRVVLASQIHFLHYLDKAWTVEHLFPLLSWDEAEAARECWDGFLSWGKLRPGLVDELLPAFEQTYGHMRELDRTRERFTSYLALAAFLADSNPKSTLLEFIRQSDEEDAAHLTHWLGANLKDMTPEQRGQAWTSWLADYWAARANGTPSVMSIAEAEEWVQVALKVPEVFTRAADMVVQAPAALPRRMFFYKLDESPLISSHPTDFARLVNRALEGIRPESYLDCGMACAVLRALVPRVGADGVRGGVNSLISHGCTCAADLSRDLGL